MVFDDLSTSTLVRHPPTHFLLSFIRTHTHTHANTHTHTQSPTRDSVYNRKEVKFADVVTISAKTGSNPQLGEPQ